MRCRTSAEGPSRIRDEGEEYFSLSIIFLLQGDVVFAKQSVKIASAPSTELRIFTKLTKLAPLVEKSCRTGSYLDSFVSALALSSKIFVYFINCRIYFDNKFI